MLPAGRIVAASIVILLLLVGSGAFRRADAQGLSLPSAAPPKPAAEEIPQEAKDRFELAQQLEQLGKLGEADVQYQQALRIAPDYAEAAARLGQLKARKGDLKTALEELEKAVELRPDDPSFLYAYAGVLIAAQKYDDAIGVLNRTLKLAPDNGGVLFNLGVAYAQKKDLARALDYFRESAHVAPENPAVQYNLGHIYVQQHETELARHHFARAVQLDPKYLQARLALVEVYLKWGEMRAALTQCREASSLAPREPVLQGAIAQTLDRAGHPEAALEFYLRLLRAKPDATDARKRVVGIYLGARNYHAAQRELHILVEQEPRDASLRSEYGRVAAVLGDNKLAVEQYRLAVMLAPGEPGLRIALAKVLQQQDPDAATKVLEEAAARFPSNVDVLARLARMYDVTGNARSAVTIYETLVRLNHNSVPAQLSLAQAYVRAARFDDAIALFLSLLTADGQIADARFGLADVYLRLDELSAARVQAEWLLKRLPADTRVNLLAANIFAGLQQYDRAADCLTAALHREPQNLDARFLLAHVQEDRGATTDAVATLKQVLSIPHAARLAKVQACRELARIFMDEKQYGAARDAVASLLDDRELATVAHLLRGEAYAAEKNSLYAIAEYQKAVDANPRNVDAREKLAGLLVDGGQNERALKQYVAVIDLRPDRQQSADRLVELTVSMAGGMVPGLVQLKHLLEARLDNGGCYEAVLDFARTQQQTGLAAEMLEQLAREHPKSVVAAHYAADAALAAGKSDQAVVVWEGFLKQNPGNATGTLELGEVQRKAGLPAARETLLTALRDPQTTAEAQLELARLYAADKDSFAAAVAECKSALANNNDPEPVYVEMRRIYEQAGRRDEFCNYMIARYRQDHGDVALLDVLSDALVAKGSWDMAENVTQRLAAARPGSVEARLRLAAIYSHEEKHSDARRQYLSVLRVDPENETARRELRRISDGVHSGSATNGSATNH